MIESMKHGYTRPNWLLLVMYTRENPECYRRVVSVFARDYLTLIHDSPPAEKIVVTLPSGQLRSQKFSARRGDKVIDSLGNGEIAGLRLHSEHSHGPSIVVSLDIARRYHHHLFVNYVATIWPLNGAAGLHTSSLIERSLDLWQTVRAPYACAVVSGSCDELHAICAGSTVDLLAFHGQPTFGQWELPGAWSSNQIHLDRYVRGVFWGNYVTDGHLARLGDLSEESLRGVMVRRLAPGRLFLAASDEPKAANTTTAQEAMAALTRMLSPIVMPRDAVEAPLDVQRGEV